MSRKKPRGDVAKSLAKDFVLANLDLQLDSRNRPAANAHNARQVLEFDKTWRAHVWFDTFHQRVRTDLGGAPRDWVDSDDLQLLLYIQSEIQIPQMSLEAVRQAVSYVANQNRRSELAAWATNLKWDGATRAGLLMSRGFGAPDSDYTMAVGLNFLRAAVQRALEPASKVDHVVVLEGPQGAGKTRAIEILAGPYFGSLHSRLGAKDAVLEMGRRWIIELAELAALPRHQLEEMKAFVSRRVDSVRLPYGRHVVDLPRQCIFVGSTNESAYLRDPTGARRFLPIRCGAIDLPWLAENRDQLFAEAAHDLKNGASWWELPQREALFEQDSRFDQDSWQEPIDLYLALHETVTMHDVLLNALKLEVGRHDKGAQMRAAAVIERLGWVRARQGSQRVRLWVRPDPPGGSVVEKVVRINPIENHRVDPPDPPDHQIKKSRQ